jgi:Ca2+-binding RTX toxin-like protein
VAIRQGTNGRDKLSGYDGDVLYGYDGNDILDGRKYGSLRMLGGRDDDIYFIDDAGDRVYEYAGEGHDKVYCSIDNYLSELFANVEDLELTGTATYGVGNQLNNSITGNAAGNWLYGLDGDDTLMGGGGFDYLLGGRGNDTYIIGYGSDPYVDRTDEYANEGTDQVLLYLPTSLYVLQDNVENLFIQESALDGDGGGNVLNNRIVGNSYANLLRGHDGQDTLDGAGGADIMEGGRGNDTFIVDHAGDDVVENANEGKDWVKSIIDYTLDANVEDLTLLEELPNQVAMIPCPISGTGNGLNNNIWGNSADNVLRGEQGNDFLDGGFGADEMYGGRDDDMYVVDNAGDEVIEYQNEGWDTVLVDFSYTLGPNVEELDLEWFCGAINGTGNRLDNCIFGNDAANVLDGAGGSDLLYGGPGPDTFRFAHSDGGFNSDDEEDVIYDFEVGIDRIDLRETEIDNWNDLTSGGDGDFMEQVGSDVVIYTTDWDMVTVANVQLASLTQSHFLF